MCNITRADTDGFAREIIGIYMKYAQGSCYCKKVKFKVALPPFWNGHCHCHQCQRLQGAAFATWVGFKTKGLKILDPHRTFKTFNKGNADIGFCVHCGTTFYFRYNKKGGKPKNAIYFSRANIHTRIALKPSEHIYYESHAPWFKVNDGLPKRKTVKKKNSA
jgi:hypothetical protein